VVEALVDRVVAALGVAAEDEVGAVEEASEASIRRSHTERFSIREEMERWMLRIFR
jgi:hypothetical protein